jgi:heme/copper-type cytochrome/quinol oxidase subunit 2
MAYGTYGKKNNAYMVSLGKPRERNHVEDLDIDGMMMTMMMMMMMMIIIIMIIIIIITKSFRKYVSNIPGNHEVKELQKTAILGTAHILRKVLT